MVLAAMILPMMILVIVGRRARKFTARYYVVAFLVALAQVAVAVFKMFTMERPPMF